MIVKIKPIKDNTLKECVKNYGKTVTSAFKEYCLIRDDLHREAKKDIAIKEIARQTPFSYSDILPLYERLGKDKEKTLKAINFCSANELSLSNYGH